MTIRAISYPFGLLGGLAAGALLWLAIAFVIGRWVKSLIETVLPSLGFDNSVRALGVMPAASNPSRIVGTIAMTAVLLGAAIEAEITKMAFFRAPSEFESLEPCVTQGGPAEIE